MSPRREFALLFLFAALALGGACGLGPGAMNSRYKTLLAGMLAVALAFGIAIPLGFWLRPRFSAIPDRAFGTMVAIVLVAIAAGAIKALRVPFWPARRRWRADGRRPDPDTKTGYEVIFEDFRRLVSEPYSQPAIGALLREWYGYRIDGQGPGTVVRSADGKTVPLRPLHSRIQLDPPKERSLYGRMMDLWR